jgi:hypothetical protein
MGAVRSIVFSDRKKNLEKKERMLRRKLEKSKKGFGKGWEKVGESLGRAWEKNFLRYVAVSVKVGKSFPVPRKELRRGPTLEKFYRNTKEKG